MIYHKEKAALLLQSTALSGIVRVKNCYVLAWEQYAVNNMDDSVGTL